MQNASWRKMLSPEGQKYELWFLANCWLQIWFIFEKKNRQSHVLIDVSDILLNICVANVIKSIESHWR